MILWVIYGCTTHYHWRFDDFMGYTTHYHWWLHGYTSHYHWWSDDFLGLHYPLSLLGIIIIQKFKSLKGLETQVSFVVITRHADCYLLRLLPKFSASKHNWTESWWIKCIKLCFNTKAVSTSFQHQKDPPWLCSFPAISNPPNWPAGNLRHKGFYFVRSSKCLHLSIKGPPSFGIGQRALNDGIFWSTCVFTDMWDDICI